MAKLQDTGERLIPELHQQSLAYGEHLARYYAAKELVEKKVVLDIASGAGYGSAFLAETAKTVIGVDYDKDAIAYASKLYGRKNLEFKVGDAQDLPLEDNSMEVVVCLETIEHLPDADKFLQEVSRVLKPEGVFYVSTPNDKEFTEGNVFHIHELDFKELSKLLDKHFKNITYYYQASWYASGVLSEQDFTAPATLSQATKTFPQSTTEAIYFLAVATNGKTKPSLRPNAVISDKFSSLRAQEQSRRTTERIQDLETENEHLKIEARRLDREISTIYNSKGWKLLTKVYTAKSHLPTRKK